MFLSMKENEALYPLYIGVLREDAVVPRPEHRAHAIQSFGRSIAAAEVPWEPERCQTFYTE